MSSVAAFSAVCAWTGVSKVFFQSSNSKDQSVRGDMEHRNLGGLDVSAIGLGCLPMVGLCKLLFRYRVDNRDKLRAFQGAEGQT